MHDLTEYEAKLLVDSVLLEHTGALLKRVEKMRDVKRDIIEINPQINDKKISEDFRYGLGYIQALNDVLNISMMARTFLNNTEKQG